MLLQIPWKVISRFSKQHHLFYTQKVYGLVLFGNISIKNLFGAIAFMKRYRFDFSNGIVHIEQLKCRGYTMTRSELIRIICQKSNVSISEISRRIGQTPQNFNKKILRNTVSEDELSKILLELHIIYEQKIKFSDGSSVTM